MPYYIIKLVEHEYKMKAIGGNIEIQLALKMRSVSLYVNISYFHSEKNSHYVRTVA